MRILPSSIFRRRIRRNDAMKPNDLRYLQGLPKMTTPFPIRARAKYMFLGGFIGASVFGLAGFGVVQRLNRRQMEASESHKDREAAGVASNKSPPPGRISNGVAAVDHSSMRSPLGNALSKAMQRVLYTNSVRDTVIEYARDVLTSQPVVDAVTKELYDVVESDKMVEKCSETIIKSISSPQVNGTVTTNLLNDETVSLVKDRVVEIVVDPSVTEAGSRALWNSLKHMFVPQFMKSKAHADSAPTKHDHLQQKKQESNATPEDGISSRVDITPQIKQPHEQEEGVQDTVPNYHLNGSTVTEGPADKAELL